MRSLTHPPQKNGVTRVTGVTVYFNPLNILSFAPVTRLGAESCTSCNATHGCYTYSPSLPLLVNHFRRMQKRSARWLCHRNTGRGMARGELAERSFA